MKTLLSRLRRAVLPAALLLWGYPVPAAAPFSWDLLWAGSWEEGGNLVNRGDLKFHFPQPGLTLRWEMLDRREEGALWSGPWENKGWNGGNWEKGRISFLEGLYHQPTGSRILYGPLEDWGLAARIRNPWGRGLPFAESRKASMADLRTAPSKSEDELYVYLGSPYLRLPWPPVMAKGPELRAFVSGKLNPARLALEGGSSYVGPLGKRTALGAGLEGRLGRDFSLSLETFHTAGEIPGEKSTAWFLDSPPLPDRDFRLYGLGLLLHTPYFGLSGDAAWSRTQINGEDMYAGLGIRVGNKGIKSGGSFWQLSLAADGAGPRYIGSDASIPGAAFRTGGKLEWQWGKAGFFRLHTSLSGPGLAPNASKGRDFGFDRSSSGLYYRPPTGNFPLRISRISLNASRDSREDPLIKDSAGLGLSVTGSPRVIARSLAQGLARFGLDAGTLPIPEGTLGLSLSGALSGSPKAGNPGRDGTPPPWPFPRGPYIFESFKTGTELSWSQPLPLGPLNRFMNGPRGPQRRGNLQLKAGIDYTAAKNDTGELTESRDLSLSAVLRGKLGRFGVKLNYPDFPAKPFDSEVSLREAWELSLSWKREWR
jgi:hypothetical protein